MPSYIGKVQVGESEQALVGSTLYGICNVAAGTAAKTVTATDDSSGKFINAHYDNLIQGSTIHVKFVYGNTVTSGATLAVGTTLAKNIVGNFTCPAGTILSFTLDENEYWVVNDNVDTNTEYVFKTAYNASTNKALTESDIAAAAVKGVIENISQNTSSSDLPTTAAVVSYVQTMTGGLAGLSGAMHFRGIAANTITDGGHENPGITGYDFGTNGANAVDGDVVVYGQKEYVWVNNAWEELGDEGSFAFDNAVIHNNLLTTAGDLIYASDANTPARLAIGTGNNKFLTVSNGLPAWGIISNTDVGLGNVDNIKQIPFTTATTAGDLLYFNGTSYTRLGIGTAGQVLKVNGAANAPYWTADDNSDTKVTQTGITADNEYAILIKNATGTTDETNGVNFPKTTGKLVTINPSTGTLTAAAFSGDGSSLTNVIASSVDWANVTNKVTATTNTLGLVKTTSSVLSATGYTASPIIDGVVYYQDTDTHYTSSGSANALTNLYLKYIDSSSNTQTDTITTTASTATALGVVSSGILYLKSIYYNTTSVSTGVQVDNS